MRKDLLLAADRACETGVPMPSTNAVKELYGMAIALEWGDEDFAAIYEALRGKQNASASRQ